MIGVVERDGDIAEPVRQLRYLELSSGMLL